MKGGFNSDSSTWNGERSIKDKTAFGMTHLDNQLENSAFQSAIIGISRMLGCGVDGGVDRKSPKKAPTTNKPANAS
jgi:hypothetical protein